MAKAMGHKDIEQLIETFVQQKNVKKPGMGKAT